MERLGRRTLLFFQMWLTRMPEGEHLLLSRNHWPIKALEDGPTHLCYCAFQRHTPSSQIQVPKLCPPGLRSHAQLLTCNPSSRVGCIEVFINRRPKGVANIRILQTMISAIPPCLRWASEADCRILMFMLSGPRTKRGRPSMRSQSHGTPFLQRASLRSSWLSAPGTFQDGASATGFCLPLKYCGLLQRHRSVAVAIPQTVMDRRDLAMSQAQPGQG